MAGFQPIEDAGPRLAFGIIRFLRVFVAAASPAGVLAKNLQEPRRSLDSSRLLKRTPGRDGTMVLRNRFGRKKWMPGKFFIGWI